MSTGQLPPPLHTKATGWWYSLGEDRHGPVSEADLRALYAAGRLRHDTPVWHEGREGWLPLSRAGIISSSSSSEAPPPSPPPATPRHSGEPTPEASPTVINTWAWALVAVPLLLGVVEVVLPVLGASSAGPALWLVAIGLNTWFALSDVGELRDAGYDTRNLPALAVFVVPVYLFVRARRLGSKPVHLAAWLAAFVVSLTPAFADFAGTVAGVEIDPALVEEGIDDWLADDLGVRGATVSCPPGVPVKRGETFACSVEHPTEGFAVIDVEVTSEAGDVVWQIRW